MPLLYNLRGIMKKARLELYPYKYDLSLGILMKHLIRYPSRILYFLYIPLLIYAAYGIILKSLTHVLPLIITLTTYLLYQVIIRRGGLIMSMKNLVKGLIFGIPYSVALSYYMIKYLIRHYLKRTYKT